MPTMDSSGQAGTAGAGTPSETLENWDWTLPNIHPGHRRGNPPAGPLAKAGPWYASRMGWRVLPVGYREKVPIIRNWPELASNDHDTIARWVSEWPEANVGIATGAASGFVALDVDPRHGGDIALDELEQAHGPLPATVEALTGSKGRHLLFACPRVTIHNSSGRLGPGLDIRGDGGFIVAAPSIHPCGGTYTWTNPPHETPLAPMPTWMVEALTEPARAPQSAATDWRTLVATLAKEGQRTPTIARLVGHWLAHGISPEESLTLAVAWNARWCDPPHADEHVVSTVVGIVEARTRRLREMPHD